MDIVDHSVTRGGKPIRTPTEFEILSLLVRGAGQIVPYRRFVDFLRMPTVAGAGKRCAHRSGVCGAR